MPLTLPFTLTNGTTADANQVMADFNAIVNYVNNNLQPNLNLPLSVADGGTGASAGPAACINLGALQAANNLSDLANFSTACTNIGALQVANNLSDVASGSISCANIGALQVANNLTDVASANTALNNLLPSQATHAGAVLKTDGTNTSWSLLAAITGNMAAHGHVTFPVGGQNLTINWGTFSGLTSGSPVTVTFDQAFGSSFFVGFVTQNTNQNAAFGIDSPTTSDMQIVVFGSSTYEGYWMAIGI